MPLTHNDIKIGDKVANMSNDEIFTVTDVLDGWRGIGVTRTGDIHSKNRFFVDVEDIYLIREF